MKILVTGASGYIGNKLVHVLADSGNEVNALIRPTTLTANLIHPNIHIHYGDITNRESLSVAMKDCKQVYHLAGFAKMWAKDRNKFYKINVGGTENVLRTALKEGVDKLVYTSSCGVWSPDKSHVLAETDPRISSFDNDYDLSKHLAEKLIREYCCNGLSAVIVNLPRVYGPGLKRYSNAVNRFILKVLNNKITPLPWQLETKANYAFIDDVIKGHLLAMEKGSVGERYILGGENISYKKLIETIISFDNDKKVFIRIPSFLLQGLGWIEYLIAKVSSYDPEFTPGLARRLQMDKMFDCSKAIHQLGYSVTPFEEGMRITINHLKIKNYELSY